MTCTRSGIGQGQLVGELAGAVGAAVVDDQHVHVGTRVVHASDDQRQVLPLVVGGDDDQSALTRALSSPRVARAPLLVTLMWLLYRLPSPAEPTHEPPIVQHCGDHSRNAEATSRPWTTGPHRVAGVSCVFSRTWVSR